MIHLVIMMAKYIPIPPHPTHFPSSSSSLLAFSCQGCALLCCAVLCCAPAFPLRDTKSPPRSTHSSHHPRFPNFLGSHPCFRYLSQPHSLPLSLPPPLSLLHHPHHRRSLPSFFPLPGCSHLSPNPLQPLTPPHLTRDEAPKTRPPSSSLSLSLPKTTTTMVRLSLLAVLAAASLTPAAAFKWSAARATPEAAPLPSIVQRFKPPKPTQAPDAPYDLLNRGAVRRAASSTGAITAYEAPDATCGYFDGRPGE